MTDAAQHRELSVVEHKLRGHIVPSPAVDADPDGDATPPMSALARRLDWASQLERVFGSQVTQCPQCGMHDVS